MLSGLLDKEESFFRWVLFVNNQRLMLQYAGEHADRTAITRRDHAFHKWRALLEISAVSKHTARSYFSRKYSDLACIVGSQRRSSLRLRSTCQDASQLSRTLPVSSCSLNKGFIQTKSNQQYEPRVDTKYNSWYKGIGRYSRGIVRDSSVDNGKTCKGAPLNISPNISTVSKQSAINSSNTLLKIEAFYAWRYAPKFGSMPTSPRPTYLPQVDTQISPSFGWKKELAGCVLRTLPRLNNFPRKGDLKSKDVREAFKKWRQFAGFNKWTISYPINVSAGCEMGANNRIDSERLHHNWYMNSPANVKARRIGHKLLQWRTFKRWAKMIPRDCLLHCATSFGRNNWNKRVLRNWINFVGCLRTWNDMERKALRFRLAKTLNNFSLWSWIRHTLRQRVVNFVLRRVVKSFRGLVTGKLAKERWKMFTGAVKVNYKARIVVFTCWRDVNCEKRDSAFKKIHNVWRAQLCIRVLNAWMGKVATLKKNRLIAETLYSVNVTSSFFSKWREFAFNQRAETFFNYKRLSRTLPWIKDFTTRKLLDKVLVKDLHCLKIQRIFYRWRECYFQRRESMAVVFMNWLRQVERSKEIILNKKAELFRKHSILLRWVCGVSNKVMVCTLLQTAFDSLRLNAQIQISKRDWVTNQWCLRIKSVCWNKWQNKVRSPETGSRPRFYSTAQSDGNAQNKNLKPAMLKTPINGGKLSIIDNPLCTNLVAEDEGLACRRNMHLQIQNYIDALCSSNVIVLDDKPPIVNQSNTVLRKSFRNWQTSHQLDTKATGGSSSMIIFKPPKHASIKHDNHINPKGTANKLDLSHDVNPSSGKGTRLSKSNNSKLVIQSEAPVIGGSESKTTRVSGKRIPSGNRNQSNILMSSISPSEGQPASRMYSQQIRCKPSKQRPHLSKMTRRKVSVSHVSSVTDIESEVSRVYDQIMAAGKMMVTKNPNPRCSAGSRGRRETKSELQPKTLELLKSILTM